MGTDPAAVSTLLRHVVATIAYRGAKTLRDAPDDFAAFQASPTSRTPGQVLAHICDVLDWGVLLASGESRWREAPPQAWDRDTERFFASLRTIDELLASPAPLQAPAEKLFQGPLADVLTHIGQLAMLRRLAGAPIRGENYFEADVAAGRLALDQTPPGREFD